MTPQQKKYAEKFNDFVKKNPDIIGSATLRGFRELYPELTMGEVWDAYHNHFALNRHAD